MNTEENSTSALCDWSTELIEFSKDEDYRVRISVAENLNTPADTLVELSKDKSPSVRLNVAENPNTPADTLVELSKDKDESVRFSVARRNPNTPVDTLVELSNDEDENVRIAVALNPNMLKKFQLYIKEFGQEVSIQQDLEEEWEIFRLSQIEENFNLPIFCPLRLQEFLDLSKH